MKRAATICAQLVIFALGIGILAALLYEPHIEGVNANATTLSEIYFDDPFLAYIYFSFIAVFIGLYQAWKLVGYIGRGEGYSERSARALRTIQSCAYIFAGLIFAAVTYIVSAVRGEDDIAGGVAIGLFFIIVSLATAVVAGTFKRKFQRRIQTAQ